MVMYDCDVERDRIEKGRGIEDAIERAIENMLTEHLSINADATAHSDSYGNSHKTVEIEVLFKGKVISTTTFYI